MSACDTDPAAKFNAVISDAEKEGQAKTVEKLQTFAKDAGYEVTVEEIIDFFKKLEPNGGMLFEEELDSVAGGERLNSKPKLSTTERGCPIRLSVMNSPGQQCPITDL